MVRVLRRSRAPQQEDPGDLEGSGAPGREPGYWTGLRSSPHRWLPVAVITAALVWVVRSFWVTSVPHPVLVADSWLYYDMSLSVLRDPGYARTIESYLAPGNHIATFPFGYPVLVAVVNAIFKTEYRSLLIVNLGLVLPFALTMEVAAWRLFRRRGVGMFLGLALLCSGYHVQDMMLGGSEMAAVFCLGVLVMVLAKAQPPTWRQAGCAGLASGAWVMMRFDGLLPALALPVMLVAVRLWKVRHTLPYLGGLVVGVGPWIVYSMARFGTFFASDNNIGALAVQAHVHVNYYLPNGTATAFDDPAGWWARVSGNFPDFLEALGFALTNAILPRYLAAATVIVLVYGAVQAKRSGTSADRWSGVLVRELRDVVTAPPVRLAAALTASTLAGLVVTVMTSGLAIPRYYITLIVAFELLLVAMMMAVPRHPPAGATIATAAAAHLGWYLPLALVAVTPAWDWISHRDFAPYHVGDQIWEVAACAQPGERIVVVALDPALYLLGPMYGITAIYEPFNFKQLSRDERLAFLRTYQVTAIYIDPSVRPKTAAEAREIYEDLLGLPAGGLKDPCAPGLLHFPKPP